MLCLRSPTHPFRAAVKTIRCSSVASSGGVSITFSVDALPLSGIQMESFVALSLLQDQFNSITDLVSSIRHASDQAGQ